MNLLMLIGGILSLIAALIHMVVGEKTDIAQLLKTHIQLNLKLELRGVWYAFGLDLGITSLFLLFLAFKSSLVENELLIVFFSLRFILYGLGILVVILMTNRKYLFKVPQWLLLLAIGIFTSLALYT